MPHQRPPDADLNAQKIRQTPEYQWLANLPPDRQQAIATALRVLIAQENQSLHNMPHG